ncbi:MAG TPA: hypothetical protein VKF14_06430 [Candidatus Dormibacteraeota bacterium]|nr:hypothetical protein [Candidatus Dormibacteraeota bacterium]
MDWPLWLLLAATIVNAMLVGASLDQVIKQLPARRRIGAVAFSEYSKAADLGHGIFWYGALGLGSAALTLVAVIVVLTGRHDLQVQVAAWSAVALTAAHSFTTARAAPINFSQRRAAGDAVHLEAIFDRFERWSTARAGLQLLTLMSVAWTLAAYVSGR